MFVEFCFLLLVVESMSKSAFLDMLKSSSDKARTRETNEEQKDKVMRTYWRSQVNLGIAVWTNECESSAVW